LGNFKFHANSHNYAVYRARVLEKLEKGFAMRLFLFGFGGKKVSQKALNTPQASKTPLSCAAHYILKG
jgi:hypothetical protein